MLHCQFSPEADLLMWWENDGTENFTQHILSDTCEFAGTVWAEDIDLDGDVDVLADVTGAAKICCGNR